MSEKYLYLEDVEGDRALEFVGEESAQTKAHFEEHPQFKAIESSILKDLNDPEKIPIGDIVGEYIYNFWKDEVHVRGLWRRQLLADYLVNSESWEVLLDIDALAQTENENWLFQYASIDHKKKRRALVHLSRGGKDACEVREYDLESKSFLQNGYFVPESKSMISWVNEDLIIIGTDFGEGSLTVAGYPRMMKLWNRGENLLNAETVYEVPKDYELLWPYVDQAVDKVILLASVVRYQNEFIALDLKTKETQLLNLPCKLELENRLGNDLIFTAIEDVKIGIKEYLSGDFFTLNEQDLLKGKLHSKLLFRPARNQAVDELVITKSKVFMSVLEDVKSKLFQLTAQADAFVMEPVDLPEQMSTAYMSSSSDERDDFFLIQEGFLSPITLYYYNPESNQFIFIKKNRVAFAAEKYSVEQFFAVSKDNVKVPYFRVANKNLKLDGNNPTWVNAYGGFQISKLPSYAASLGVSWLDRGGVYVLANIRGGAEYGPRWHNDALREKRQNAFNDFYAVAEDLIDNKVTCPEKLAISGGSNGGLLTGVALTQRPDLYSAVAISVPLLDMQRYHKLLAGYLWVGEYGDPEVPADLDFILKYSPFHNISSEKVYPKPLIMTSTKDDRVHPGHARKMSAKMQDMGHQVYYYENAEGGHAGAANLQQVAFMQAMKFVYFYEQLKMH